ncbi:exosortase-dependent surface protein XDP1 [Paraglaciecola sp.]|uniref:exosortase-dependent surface protein XDP1 n=1 Tax=Paraglaciecola sp. TaxID=1920173 RepID=UPI003263D050
MIFTKNKFIVSTLLMFFASTSMSYAESTTWVFETGASEYDVDSYTSEFGNQLSVDSDNDGTADLTIEAWASTGCGLYCGNDNEVEQGYASTNAWGLLNNNLDEGLSNNSSHTVDNKGGDVDMMLLSFTESTALTGIDLGWAYNDTDISIAAFSNLPTLSGNTWAEIATQSIFSASFSNIGTSPYTLVNEVSNVVVEAQYWLVGAYTSVFGNLGSNDDSYDDRIKIASITTETTASTPVAEVPEPSTIMFFALFGLILVSRRKATK